MLLREMVVPCHGDHGGVGEGSAVVEHVRAVGGVAGLQQRRYLLIKIAAAAAAAPIGVCLGVAASWIFILTINTVSTSTGTGKCR